MNLIVMLIQICNWNHALMMSTKKSLRGKVLKFVTGLQILLFLLVDGGGGGMWVGGEDHKIDDILWMT